jgi:DNA (cytosine-5)-methyltransferase 3A
MTTQYLILKEQQYKFNGDSYLYWEFVRILEDANPTYFLLENVVMIKKWKDIISKSLGVLPIRINSSLVSAQNRDRYYWTNIPGITTPEDKGILISDIDEKAIGGCGTRNQFAGNYYPDGIRKKYDEPNFTVRKDFKSNCLTCGGNLHKIMLDNGLRRFLTIDEWEKLQTLPVGYTDIPGLSITDRKCAIGNGWTIDVIIHILNFIPYEELS